MTEAEAEELAELVQAMAGQIIELLDLAEGVPLQLAQEIEATAQRVATILGLPEGSA
jgi:hypothetical protein